MLEFFGRIFGVDVESEGDRLAKIKSLEGSRKRLSGKLTAMPTDAGEADLLAVAVDLGSQMASERSVAMENYSSDIILAVEKTSSVTEMALILSAYIAQAPIERMEFIPGNVLPRLGKMVTSEQGRSRFDETNEADMMAVELVFAAIGSRLGEVRQRSTYFRESVYVNIENAMWSASELSWAAPKLIAEMAGSRVLEEKVSAWRVMEKRLDAGEVIEVISDQFISDPQGTAVFFEKEMAILAGKLEGEGGREGELERLFESLFGRVYKEKSELDRLGYWEIVVSALSQHFRTSPWSRVFPVGLRRAVDHYHLRENRVKVAIERRGSGRVFDELESLGLGNMSDAFALLEVRDKKSLLKYLSEVEDRDRDEMLSTIFEASDSSDLETDYLLTAKGRVLVRVKEDLLDPRLDKLFVVMAREENRDRFSMELAIVSALVPFTKMSMEMRKALAAYHHDTDQKLLLSNGDWYLCSNSEHRMLRDILSNSAILVNDKFLFKFSGKKAALCLETFTDPSGDVFVGGVWYALVDSKSKKILNSAFGDGIVSVGGLPASWAVMRSASDDNTYTDLKARSLMAIAKNYADWCKQTRGKSGVVKRRRSDLEEGTEGY